MVGIVVLRFREAFCTAPHSRVELHGCGMSGFPASALGKELCKGRAQRVAVHKATSGWQCSAGLFRRAQFQGQSCSMYLSAICMQKLNAPLAILVMVPNWEVLLTLLRDKMPCIGSV